nr:hypothetical protein [Neobacillus sp. Marseille-Q6967]
MLKLASKKGQSPNTYSPLVPYIIAMLISFAAATGSVGAKAMSVAFPSFLSCQTKVQKY